MSDRMDQVCATRKRHEMQPTNQPTNECVDDDPDQRYLQPPKHWIRADLESKELLTFCIKRIKGLNKVKLVDAGFIWTEPHSKRLKTKLTIQKEVLNGKGKGGGEIPSTVHRPPSTVHRPPSTVHFTSRVDFSHRSHRASFAPACVSGGGGGGGDFHQTKIRIRTYGMCTRWFMYGVNLVNGGETTETRRMNAATDSLA